MYDVCSNGVIENCCNGGRRGEEGIFCYFFWCMSFDMGKWMVIRRRLLSPTVFSFILSHHTFIIPDVSLCFLKRGAHVCSFTNICFLHKSIHNNALREGKVYMQGTHNAWKPQRGCMKFDTSSLSPRRQSRIFSPFFS